MDEAEPILQEDSPSKHSKDETNTATTTDTSNNSMDQDVNTNTDDYTQGSIVNSEGSDESYTQENLPNDSLDKITTADDKSAERTNKINDLDFANVADNNSDNNDCLVITIEDENNSTVEDMDANCCESISDIGTSTLTHSNDTKDETGSADECEIIHVDSVHFEEDSQACWSGGHWSGSGVWERTENRRWIAVHQHRIPNRKRSISESSLVTDLGTGQFVNRFEFVEPSDNSENSDQFRIVVSKESMIRLKTSIASEDCSVPGTSSSGDDPVPGPSSAPQSGDSPARPGTSSQQDHSRREARRINTLLHRTLSKRAKKNRKNKKRARQRKRDLRNFQRDFGQSQQQRLRREGGGGSTPKRRIMLTRSADSSPGRNSPSPTSLSRICLYWEKRLASPEYVILSDPESEP